MLSSTTQIISTLDSKPLLNSKQLDALRAADKLTQQGYPHTTLDSPLLYRGDTRKPDGENGIFTTGFYRYLDDNFDAEPIVRDDHTTSNCISTSKNLTCAIGFADFQARLDQEEFSWVYLIHLPRGIDLTKPTSTNTKNAALKVAEVALTGIPPENILAAFQIKSTKNPLTCYYIPEFTEASKTNKNPVDVHILDFKINYACHLKEIDFDLFAKTINEFKKIYENRTFCVKPNTCHSELSEGSSNDYTCTSLVHSKSLG